MQNVATAEEAIPAILVKMREALIKAKLPHAEECGHDALHPTSSVQTYRTALDQSLGLYVQALDKPLVIFFDEADCLADDALISFLRQLRDGYISRSIAPCPSSVALVGLRNLRDYKVRAREDQQSLGSASPFNVIAESMTLRNFTKEEVLELYAQHTQETGQIFDTDATDFIWEQTQGQPWLVNAIAREVIEKLLLNDFSQHITFELTKKAIKNIILRRDVHIDSLIDKLKDPRVRNIIQPMILGTEGAISRESDDYYYVKDLGLIRDDRNAKIEPANPIYGEVIVRMLNRDVQEMLQSEQYPYKMQKYYKAGKIDMLSLLRDFQVFWRENGAIWTQRFDYEEAAPHLVLMAFLQRIVNGGGFITREMAAESGRLDLCVHFEGKKYPIELKIRRGPKTRKEGLTQLERYMDILGCKEGWLLIFDERTTQSWSKKIFDTVVKQNGKKITVMGA
jgi:hypothetical protein